MPGSLTKAGLQAKRREPRQVSFDHQKMAKLEGRIEKAALVIIQKAITRAGVRETSAKSPEKEEKVGCRLAEADLNSSCHTFDRRELHNSSVCENLLTLQTENEKSKKILSEHIKWFGRRQ